ncbi:MAG: redoxin domain-containing protein [Prolixibacteraceae bacterium]
MKRKFVITASIIISVLIISFIFFEFQKKHKNKAKYQKIPDFAYEALYNNIQTTANLPNYDGYIIMIFSPGCEACQLEATDYLKYNARMQNLLFLMISPDSLEKIKKFAVKQILISQDNFMFGHVDLEEIENHFGQVYIPSIFIYNSKKELIRKERVANSEIILNCFKKPEDPK